MAKLSWSTSIKTIGSPTILVEAEPVEVEATDRIEVSIPSGASKKVVNLQLGNVDGVHLLVIKSSLYHKDLKFTVSDSGGDSAEIKLLGPQVYSGGALVLFAVDPEMLKFTNSAANPEAKIEIFVARDATP